MTNVIHSTCDGESVPALGVIRVRPEKATEKLAMHEKKRDAKPQPATSQEKWFSLFRKLRLIFEVK